MGAIDIALWLPIILVITGTGQTMSMQYLNSLHAYDPSALVQIWMRYFLMCLFGLFLHYVWKISYVVDDPVDDDCGDSDMEEERRAAKLARHRSYLTLEEKSSLGVCAIAFVNCINVTTTIIGIGMIGSGLFQIIFSSGLITTGLLSKFVLHKHVTSMQWMALVVVTCGLCASTLPPSFFTGGDDESPVPPTPPEPRLVFVKKGGSDEVHTFVTYQDEEGHRNVNFPLGAFVTFISASFSALQSILYERLREYRVVHKLPAYTFVALLVRMGGAGSFMTTLYILCYTVPHIDSMDIQVNSVSLSTVLSAHGLFLLLDLAQTCAFWPAVAYSGSLACGLSNAARALVVFALSAALFCSSDEKQCFNMSKGFSCCLVIIGIVTYLLYAPPKGVKPHRR